MNVRRPLVEVVVLLCSDFRLGQGRNGENRGEKH